VGVDAIGAPEEALSPKSQTPLEPAVSCATVFVPGAIDGGGAFFGLPKPQITQAARSGGPLSAGSAGSGLTNQTREQLLSSKTSFEKLIAEHRQKPVDYIADPFAHDNRGILRDAPTAEIRQKIISGRVRELESQITKQEGELRKIVERLGEGGQ
jgi:hypothetical protein